MIDPKKILAVRERTDLPLLKCREALILNDNDVEMAVQYLKG